MGTGSLIKAGDVQIMSAGSGVKHSEFNPSKTEEVHFLQIWIAPNKKGITPRYQQTHFNEEKKRGKLKQIISPEGEGDSLAVYQDTRVFAGLITGPEKFQYTLAPHRYAYIHVVNGELRVGEIQVKAGDGIRVKKESKIEFSDGKNAEVLLFDLREMPLI
jgi:redox-sensitive bicupin YhaK (pirin superfamily)